MVVKATLDSFWSQASKIVANHVQEVRKCYGGMFGYPPMPIFGPWALYNHLGMDTAIMVLLRSMEKGRAGAAVKYGAARKVQATLTVLWESSPLSKGDPTLSAQLVKGRFIATKCPSEGQWYQHFKTGICSWMGDVVDQDWWAYTIEVLLALIEMYKQEWQTYYLQMPLLSISACVFLLVSALGGMTAYEVVWTDLTALLYIVTYCEAAEDNKAVSWLAVGRFNSRHGILDCYMIPIAGVTHLGIQFFTWTQRFIQHLAQEGYEDGWAFQRMDGTRAKASDYQENIFRKLEIMQVTTTLIDPGCTVWDEYGIQRSGQHFFTTRCTNMKVDKHDIKLQCWWSTDRANGV
jgi:hypothetical protein